jgi:hypothetical protein
VDDVQLHQFVRRWGVDGDPVLPARRALGRGKDYSKNAKPNNVVAQQLTSSHTRWLAIKAVFR